MRHSRLLIPVLLVIVAACSLPVGDQGSASTWGGHYELAITHRLDEGVLGAGSTTWSARDFSAVDDGEHFLVTLDDEGRRVELQSLTDDRVMSGHIDGDVSRPSDVSAEESACYFIDEGLFAGGRLVIWTLGSTLRAELTILGSGRPVLSSERGDLEPID